MRSARSARSLKWVVVVGSLAAALLAPSAASAAISARGSVSQVYVTGGTPGDTLTLLNKKKKRVARQPVGSLGGVVFRRIAPG